MLAGVHHTVWLNEEFRPFNFESTNYPMKKGLYAFTTLTYIAVPTLGALNVVFMALDENKIGKLTALTPLKPEIGYPFDSEDLSYETRKQKLTRLTRKKRTKIIKGISISAVINDNSDKFWNLWTHPSPHTWVLREEARRLFHHIFLVITLPNGGSFASRASWGDADSPPTVNFFRFFPSDTGSLPEIEIHASNKHALKVNYGDEGFLLLLPKDNELLKAMQAKFVFLPDID